MDAVDKGASSQSSVQPAIPSPVADAKPAPKPTPPISPPSAMEEKIQLEALKVLLSSSMDYVRNAMQVLQTLTSLLLTAYIALLVGFGKSLPIHTIPLFLAPAVTLVVALGCGVFASISNSGVPFILGDFQSTISAYSKVVESRKRQIRLPLAFLLLSIIGIAIVVYFMASTQS